MACLMAFIQKQYNYHRLRKSGLVSLIWCQA